MGRFIHQAECETDHVCLEIQAAGGKLSATLRPPSGSARSISFDQVPLLRAVKMAKLMSEFLHTDVLVIDPLGIWHDWLVEWARTPLAMTQIDDAELTVAEGNGAGEAGSKQLLGLPHTPLH